MECGPRTGVYEVVSLQERAFGNKFEDWGISFGDREPHPLNTVTHSRSMRSTGLLKLVGVFVLVAFTPSVSALYQGYTAECLACR